MTKSKKTENTPPTPPKSSSPKDEVETETRVVNTEVKEEEVEKGEQVYFFVAIGCGYTFRNLVESLLKFSNGATLYFNKDGFSYRHIDPNKNYSVSADFPATLLNSYLFNGDEEMTIALNIDDFHKKIKDLKVQEMLRIFTNPEDNDRKFFFQLCENEESEISSYRHIRSKYIQKVNFEMPEINRAPDRVISNETFMKMGEGFKSTDAPYVYISKKKYPKETQVSFEVKTENESSGAVNAFANPSMFLQDEDECEVSSIIISKNIFEKFSLSSKFNKDGIVRVYIEHRKYAMFELSISYIGFLRIYMKDVDRCK